MSEMTLFDKIIARQIPAYFVWEDENYCAFLTPFANTPGVTVVVPKKNPGDYAFNLSDEALSGLIVASKTVAKILEAAFGDKVGLVFEGEAVPHVHAKLYPMHRMEGDRSTFPKHRLFMPVYPGYLTTIEGPQMDEAELSEIHKKIQEAAKS